MISCFPDTCPLLFTWLCCLLHLHSSTHNQLLQLLHNQHLQCQSQVQFPQGHQHWRVGTTIINKAETSKIHIESGTAEINIETVVGIVGEIIMISTTKGAVILMMAGTAIIVGIGNVTNEVYLI